jgi:hypothetical protein
MSNYYISKCCGEPAYTRKYSGKVMNFCRKCNETCEVTAMLDTPNGIPTDTSYIGGVNFDHDMNKDKLQTEFMNFWDEYKDKLGLGNYSDEITRFWFEKMETQKAEIISLIMGMETKDKGRESDEFDEGMEIMRAKIINTIRAKI